MRSNANKHTKPANQRGDGTWLQTRDLAMLESLAEGRVLSVQALEWLHFASWRGRYRRAAEQAGTTNAYKPSSNLYRRLRGLRQLGLIARLTRTVERGMLVMNRLPDAYALTAFGADTLRSQRELPREAIWHVDTRQEPMKNLEHSLAIGGFYAALHSELSYRGLALTDWRGDYRLSQSDQTGTPNYDRVVITGTSEPYAVLPDGTFVLNGTRYFVEIDRATRPMASWTNKLRAFEAYRASLPLQRRYGVATFTVLIIAPTLARVHQIASEVARVTRETHAAYRLLSAEHIHPTTIRRGWQRITSLTMIQRKLIDRVVDSPEFTLGPAPLWQ